MGTIGVHKNSERAAIPIQVADVDLRKVYDRLVARGLAPICASLAAVYVLVVIRHPFTIFEPQSLFLGGAAGVTIGLLLFLPFAIHRWSIPDCWSHVCDALIVAVVMGNVLLRFAILQAGNLLHKDGSQVPVKAHARFMYDKSSQPIGTQGIFRDITKHKKVEE